MDEYVNQTKNSLDSALGFFERHMRPRTDDDWDAISVDMNKYRPPLASELIAAVVNDLEREYHHATGNAAKFSRVSRAG